MADYNTEQFEKDCKALGVTLSDEQIQQFLKYYEMLVEWNEVMNLTAITEYDEVMKKHFVDSISLCKAYDVTQNKTVIDVGTGAGFPGLVLKIAFPDLQVTLLDSLNKRINFLNEVIAALGLTGVETIHGRAEDFAKPGKCREKYDLCVSRAVANLSTLSEYCLPFVKVGGKFISYKSEKITEEMNAAQHAVKILGGKMDGQPRGNGGDPVPDPQGMQLLYPEGAGGLPTDRERTEKTLRGRVREAPRRLFLWSGSFRKSGHDLRADLRWGRTPSLRGFPGKSLEQYRGLLRETLLLPESYACLRECLECEAGGGVCETHVLPHDTESGAFA